MYTQDTFDKGDRRKIIAIAVGAASLILILIIAIVVVATKKPAKTETSETESAPVASVDDGSKNESTKKESDSSKKSGSTLLGNLSTTTTPTAQNTNPAPAKQESDIPDTGPEDILPVALLAGVLVTYLSSAVLTKREA